MPEDDDPSARPSPRRIRDIQLQGRVNRALLHNSDEVLRYHTDPATHYQVKLLRNLVELADHAMEAEGLGEDVRDRIMHRIILGTPPSGRGFDAEAEIQHALREQLQRPPGGGTPPAGFEPAHVPG